MPIILTGHQDHIEHWAIVKNITGYLSKFWCFQTKTDFEIHRLPCFCHLGPGKVQLMAFEGPSARLPGFPLAGSPPWIGDSVIRPKYNTTSFKLHRDTVFSPTGDYFLRHIAIAMRFTSSVFVVFLRFFAFESEIELYAFRVILSLSENIPPRIEQALFQNANTLLIDTFRSRNYISVLVFRHGLVWLVNFNDILQVCITGTGAILRLPKCQWSNHKEYGSIDHKQNNNTMCISYRA